MLEFRWLALIALWTVLSGPVFGPPASGSARSKERVVKTSDKSTAVKKVTSKR